MATPTQSKSLQQALSSDRLPFCSGAISPSPDGLYLYYGKKHPRFIDFASATPKDTNLLLAACGPATPDHGNEDIHGKSHHKVFKMDASDFIVHSDLVGPSLMKIIEDQLLQGETDDKHIRAEPIGLNIYDEGSFFGPHKDTPRDTDMLGSLVLIYPIPTHKGGELVLHHENHEWKFDAKVITASQTSPSLAYVAFYSNVEREVLKVTTGRKVTITYNLYLVDPSLEPGAPAVTKNTQIASNFQTKLRELLERPEFLPDGGKLGFGLARHYPFTFGTDLQEMEICLKGEDARVYQVCQELQLQPSLQVIYDDDRRNEASDGIMLDEIVRDINYDYESRSYGQILVDALGGVPVNKTEDAHHGGEEDEDEDEDEYDNKDFITWISPFNQRNQLAGSCSLNGKDLIPANFSPCIIAYIAAAHDRMHNVD